MLPLLLLALLVLGLLVGVAKVLASLAMNSQAHPAPRALAGLLSVAGLGAVGATGLALLGLTAALVLGTIFVEHGPVRSVQLVRADDPWEGLSSLERTLEQEAATVFASSRDERQLDPRFPLHLLIDWAGSVEPRKIERFLQRELDWEVELIDAWRVRENDEALTRLDFGVEVSQCDLDELEMALASFGELPRRVRLEIDSR